MIRAIIIDVFILWLFRRDTIKMAPPTPKDFINIQFDSNEFQTKKEKKRI